MDTEEAVQGDAPVADTGTPSAPDAVASSNLDNSLAAMLLEGLPEAKTEEPAPTEPEAVDTEDEEVDEEPGSEAPETAAATDEPEKPAPTVDDWASQVRDNPRSINTIPAKQHPQIMEAVLNAERDVQRTAVTMAYQQGIEQGAQQATQQAQLTAAIAQIDQLRKEDPESYLAWTDEHPDRAQAYLQYKQQGRVQATAPSQPDFTPVLTSAQAQIARLESFPEAHQKVRAAIQKEDIKATPEGLKRLTELVTDELVEARIAKRNKDDEPARKTLEKRQEAATQRQSTPRPDVGIGSGASGGEDLDSLSVNELLSLGVRKDLAAAR